MHRRSRSTLTLFSAAVLVLSGCGNKDTKTEPAGASSPTAATMAVSDTEACSASAAWASSPNPPSEIGGTGVPVGSETFCQFYQFAEQWFLSLVSPSSTQGSRVFETFNVVGPSGMTSCSAGTKLTGKAALQKSLFVRVNKPKTADFDPTLPANMGQAGTGDAIYDQNGNVVLYAVLYNQTECQATASGFAPNTIEVKTSWKVLKQADPTYYTMNATVNFSTGPQNLLLGLVGFHMAINTALHPEFIWVTWEHKANDPNCNSPQTAPASGWAFTSAAAAQCLANGGIGACSQFKFNQGAAPTTPTGGTPTQVCRSYPDGTDAVPPAVGPNGNRNALNAFTIDTLNTQLVGASGILTQLPATNPLAVFANYQMQGALWTNGGQDSVTANQRGSLELANTTMETFVQAVPPAASANCFACHNFTTTSPLKVSHIYEANPDKDAVRKRLAAKKK